ncbi:MAG: arginine--tRNA ligase [Coriobacteriales bacterium]|jgi:arginyl-tRNA synthetase|nr:arginine--tRNA ligase [Coriobacteriales bacterium]
MRNLVESHISQALERAAAAGDLNLAYTPESAVERPRDPAHGDWASTIALKLAKELGRSPRDIAQIIVNHLAEDAAFARVEVAGPGFINLTLSSTALIGILRTAYEQNGEYARVDLGEHRTVNVEFISANPTGPLHVGHGRWAALGNALCKVLEHAGWQVVREFYVNDAGSQMDKFGESVAVRYLQELGQDTTMPEDGYHGVYVKDIARALVQEYGNRWAELTPAERNAELREEGYKRMLANQQEVCARLGVYFDVWFSERTLYEPLVAPSIESATASAQAPDTSPIALMLDKLRQGDYLYEEDGATWFRSTAFFDDKDRVLIKSDGSYTYFAPDTAYHWDKFERPATEADPQGGSEFLIDIWGADHHGYIPRMQAAVAALGHEGKLTVVLGQLVNLFRSGQPVRMSKRTGEMISFEELVDEVGADATKYLMLSRSSDQPIDFDIEVAKAQDASNPVYYVQYAHARICSVLRKAQESGLGVEAGVGEAPDAVLPGNVETSTLMLLTEDAERDLIRCIGQLPDLVEQCARDLAPFKLTHYAEELAGRFHRFYAECSIVSEDRELSFARLYLSEATRRVLALVLGLLGVSAPERM